MGSKSRVVNFTEKGLFSENNKAHGRTKSSLQLSVAIEEAMSIYLRELNDRLKEVLSDVDDHLFDKSSGKSDEGEHFVAMRTLRLEKENLINRFKEETVNNFKDTLGKCSSQNELEDQDKNDLLVQGLSLVEERDLEERIAIDTMTGRARKENQVALENLRQRLDVLMPNRVVTEELNPFEPSFVCGAFFDVIKTVDLTLEFKLVVYKYLERQVVEDLHFIYQKVNAFFIERGILPELKNTHIQKERSTSRKNTSKRKSESVTYSDDHQNQENTYTDSENQHVENQEILGVLSQLLSERRNNPQFGQANQVRVEQQVNTGELLDALSNIQINQPSDIQDLTNLSDIRAQISSQLPTHISTQINQGVLGQFSDDMIDVVTMLFDFILDDDSLHSEIKAIIARLQIPILKVGLVDKTFLSDRKHAARLLLNELARAGLSWEPEDAGAVVLLEKIQSISESICNDFKENVELFEELLNDFVAFKDDYRKRARIFERRTKEAEEGKAKAETARAKVNDVLKIICHKKQVPDVVKQLLKNVWVHVMFLERLRADDKGWDAVGKIAQMLVWSVQPVKDQAHLDKLIKMIPMLIKNLKLGFNKIAFSQIESSGFLDRLEDAHRDIISEGKKFIEEASRDQVIRLKPRGHFSKPEDNEIEESVEQNNFEDVIEEIEIEDIAFSAEETGKSVKRRQIEIDVSEESRQLAASLHAGSWFELKCDEEFKRCKLAARILSCDKFIFVNASGVKVAEFLTEELAAEYQLGNLKLLDDEALFDRALESVISNLRNMKSEA